MSILPGGTPLTPFVLFGTVTIRPQAATAIDIVSTPNPSRRISLASPAVRAAAVSAVSAFALDLAFPRVGAWWLIPFALAVLFRTWADLPPRAAALNGYLSGLVFFTFAFSWFGETAGALVGPLAFAIDLGPAIGEAFAFAFAAVAISVAMRRVNPFVVPLAGAAAFTAGEWMRSNGIVGVPFGQLGLALVDSPLRPLASYVGGFGLTFVIAILAAFIAIASRERRLAFPAAGIALLIAGVTALAWTTWPARTIARPTLRVAAVQGNIAQAVKSTAAARALAIDRYAAMTEAIAGRHPTLVLWPETVILTDMTNDAPMRARFGKLAQRVDAEIAVGTIVRDAAGNIQNAIVFFSPRGAVEGTVAKRQLVPFAEFLPAPAWLRVIPAIDEIGKFVQGHGPQIDPASGVGTLICWESIFGDLAYEQVRAGAKFFAVPTDDAWFGTTNGPFQHAQATTLRAVETGRWIVRAASTGISGIIAPDGTWREASALGTQVTVVGEIGDPIETPFDRIGPTTVGLTAIFVLVLTLVPWPRRRA